MDMFSITRAIFALLFVMGLIAALAWLLRRYGGEALGLKIGNDSQKRLEIVEQRMLDARRRLVLIRRDSTEHLLLLTPQGDVVVESSINEKKNA